MDTDSTASRRARWKEILKIAWPLILANSFWNLQLTIDRVFLGHYSTDALAASIAVMGIFWTPMALVQQTAAYSMTFVAQYVGAKRFDRIGPVVWHSVYVSVVGGLLVILLIPLASPLFEWIHHSERVRALEIDLFKALCFSAMPTALVAAAGGFFTGLGNTTRIMWVNGVALVANAVFGYILIFGKLGFPALGVTGAGYATALANWTAAAFGFWLVMTRKNEEEYGVRSRWRIDADLLKRYLKYGVPSGMQWALEGLAFTVFLVIVGRMEKGDAALAGSGIAVTVMLLAALPSMGVAQAVSMLVGQGLGEKRADKAELAAWSGLQVVVVYAFVCAVSFAFFPGFYLRWFENVENAALWGQVTAIVPSILLFVALFLCFDSMNLIFSFALKGAGDTRFVTAVALSLPWPLMVLPTWLTRGSATAIYWAWGAASLFIITQAIVFLKRFQGGRWKQMSVIN